MMQAAEFSREQERAAIAELLITEGLLRGAALQRIATLAAQLFETPLAAVTIVGANRLWFVTETGLESPLREGTFGTHVIESDDVLVVPDASLDSRFRDISTVRDRNIRFYAGAPLRTADGLRIGAFCVADSNPRAALSPLQEQLLTDFAEMAMSEIESRRARFLNGILLTGKVIEATALRKDGREVPVDIGLSVWRDESGTKISSTMRDITERKQREERLSKLAYYDPLTGLTRAAGLKGKLETCLETGGAATILLIEIEGMQSVNDAMGHTIGDSLLQAIAIRLLAAAPPQTVLARWSGNIFAAQLRESDPNEIRELARDIEMALSEPFEISGHRLVIGASIGAAIAPSHAKTAEDLAAAADLALQRAKADTRTNFRLFERSDGDLRRGAG